LCAGDEEDEPTQYQAEVLRQAFAAALRSHELWRIDRRGISRRHHRRGMSRRHHRGDQEGAKEYEQQGTA
jgi:hypothetical protein